MATIFALILLPALIAVFGMVLSIGTGASVGAVCAGVTFVVLAGGMFVGLYRLVHQWEDQPAE